MLLLNGFRIGTLLLNACFSLDPCIAAPNPTISGQNPTTAIARISPSHALRNSSFSPSQPLHSPGAIKRQILNSTSIVPSASTSSSPTLGSTSSIGSSLNTLASSTSSSEVAVATYGPAAPSDNHIAKLAEILCPSILVPSLTFYTLKHYSPQIAKWFEDAAAETGGQQPETLLRAFSKAIQLDKMKSYPQVNIVRQWITWMQRKMLADASRDGNLLTPEQRDEVIEELHNALDRGETVWRGVVRLILASGNRMSVDHS